MEPLLTSPNQTLPNRAKSDPGNVTSEKGTSLKVLEATAHSKSVDSTPPKNKARGSLDELKAFAVEIGLPESEGESLFEKWEGNGWKNSGNPIVDWRATAKNWKRRGFLDSQNRSSLSTPTKSRDFSSSQLAI